MTPTDRMAAREASSEPPTTGAKPVGPQEAKHLTSGRSPADVMVKLQHTAGNRAARSLALAGTLTQSRRQRALARTPVTVSYNYSEPRVGGGAYGTRAAYDVELTALEAILTMRINLVPDPGVTPQDVASVQTTAEAAWLGMWDNRFILTDQADRSQYFLRVRVQWGATHPHHTIALHPGHALMDAGNWYVVPDTPATYAHEMTHKMGALDEYVDATAVNRATPTSPGVFADHSLMGNYLTEGTGNAEVKLRQAQNVADHIGPGLSPSRTLQASFTLNAQGDRLVRWRRIRDSLAAGSAERARAAAEVTAIESDMLIPQLSAAAGIAYTPTP